MYILFQPVFWFRLGEIDKPKWILLVIWIKVAAIWLILGGDFQADTPKNKMAESAEFSNMLINFLKKIAELADLKKVNKPMFY